VLTVPDLLVRDVPDDVLAALDSRAKRLGLSRAEYVRRQLTQAARTTDEAVRESDLRQFADTFADLGDPAIMDQAWR